MSVLAEYILLCCMLTQFAESELTAEGEKDMKAMAVSAAVKSVGKVRKCPGVSQPASSRHCSSLQALPQQLVLMQAACSARLVV